MPQPFNSQQLGIGTPADVLTLIDGFYQGKHSFTFCWERLTAWLVSPAVLHGFFCEAIEEARR